MLYVSFISMKLAGKRESSTDSDTQEVYNNNKKRTLKITALKHCKGKPQNRRCLQ